MNYNRNLGKLISGFLTILITKLAEDGDLCFSVDLPAGSEDVNACFVSTMKKPLIPLIQLLQYFNY